MTGATDLIWAKSTYVTSALGADPALVGTRAGATVYLRGGVSVEATNSHSNYFS